MIEYLDKRLGKHTGVGHELQWHCPACIDKLGSESRKPKLAINTTKWMGHCWRCNFRFRDVRVLLRYLNNGRLLAEEIDILNNRVPLREDNTSLRDTIREMLVGSGRSGDEGLSPVSLPTNMIPLYESRPFFNDSFSVMASRYLKKRGIPLTDIEKFKLGFCKQGDYAGYLIFPVFQGGEQVYWTSRYCGNSPMKTKNPPTSEGHFTKDKCLFNFDACVGNKVVSICEGPFDAMAHENGMAVMGKTLSEYQLGLLDILNERGTEELVVSLDAEAIRDTESIYAQVATRFPKVTVLSLDSGDPHDNRGDLPHLMVGRRSLDITDRLRGRLT